MTRKALHALALLAWVPLLVGACRLAAPSEPGPEPTWLPLAAELPRAWRDLGLYQGECAFVLASCEPAARQAHEVARTAGRIFAEALGRWPRPGLVIAGSKDDRLLLDDAEELLDAMPRWNALATGRDPPPNGASRRRRDDVPARLAARLLSGAIPMDEPSLDFPAALRARVAYAVLLPTDDCLDATCREVTDLALEREGVSWIQLKLATAVAGHPAVRMARELRSDSLATLLEVVSTSEGLDAAEADAVTKHAIDSGALPERSRRRAARSGTPRRGSEAGSSLLGEDP